MTARAPRTRQSDHKVQLGVRISPELRLLVWQEVHRRALAGIHSSRAEIVEQALIHYLNTNISHEAYKAMDSIVAQQRARGEQASRASVMSEAILLLYALRQSVIVEQSVQHQRE